MKEAVFYLVIAVVCAFGAGFVLGLIQRDHSYTRARRMARAELELPPVFNSNGRRK